MTTYDFVLVRHDVVCTRTTSYVHTMSYVVRTYDVTRTMSYVYILYIARTTSHVRCTIRCRVLHVRCRTSCTYDIVRTYDIVGGKNPDVWIFQTYRPSGQIYGIFQEYVRISNFYVFQTYNSGSESAAFTLYCNDTAVHACTLSTTVAQAACNPFPKPIENVALNSGLPHRFRLASSFQL